MSFLLSFLNFAAPAGANIFGSAMASSFLAYASPRSGKHLVGVASAVSGAWLSGSAQLGLEWDSHPFNWRKIAGTTLQSLLAGGEAFLAQDTIFPRDPFWKNGLTSLSQKATSLYQLKSGPLFLLGLALNLAQGEVIRSLMEGNGLWQVFFGDKKWENSYLGEIAIDLGLGAVAFGANRYITPIMNDATLEQVHIHSSAKDYFHEAITTFHYSTQEARNASVRAGEYFVSRDPLYAKTCFNNALRSLPCELDSNHMPTGYLRPYSLHWRASQGLVQAWDQLLQPPTLPPWWAFRQRRALYPELLKAHQQAAIQKMESESFEEGLAHLVEADKLSRKLGLKGREKERIAVALARPRLWFLERIRLRTNIDQLKQGLDEEYSIFCSQLVSGNFKNSQIDFLTILYHNYEIVLRGMRRLDPQSGDDILKKQHFIAKYMNGYLAELLEQNPADGNLVDQANLWVRRVPSISDTMKS